MDILDLSLLYVKPILVLGNVDRALRDLSSHHGEGPLGNGQKLARASTDVEERPQTERV